MTGFWGKLVWETAVSETLLVFVGGSIICKRAPGAFLGRASLCQGDALSIHLSDIVLMGAVVRVVQDSLSS